MAGKIIIYQLFYSLPNKQPTSVNAPEYYWAPPLINLDFTENKSMLQYS